jgi:hypothetical protein
MTDFSMRRSGEETITPDPGDFSVTHPLQYSWTMFYEYQNNHNFSKDNIRKVMDVSTVRAPRLRFARGPF